MTRTFSADQVAWFRKAVPEQQADATLNQANPVSGTQYTVLDTMRNVRIKSISIQCTWTVQPTPLEVHVTIDGQSIIYTVANPVTATDYFASHGSAYTPAWQILETTDRFHTGRPFLYEGRSVMIEAEITGGTVQNLSARVKYAQY